MRNPCGFVHQHIRSRQDVKRPEKRNRAATIAPKRLHCVTRNRAAPNSVNVASRVFICRCWVAWSCLRSRNFCLSRKATCWVVTKPSLLQIHRSLCLSTNDESAWVACVQTTSGRYMFNSKHFFPPDQTRGHYCSDWPQATHT